MYFSSIIYLDKNMYLNSIYINKIDYTNLVCFEYSDSTYQSWEQYVELQKDGYIYQAR